MAQLSFDAVSMQFDDTRVLRDVSLDIEDGELMALLGPSGCGKTTMLRLAAGFERPTAGSVLKGGMLLSDANVFVAPEHRNMGIVFQSYALWPKHERGGECILSAQAAQAPRRSGRCDPQRSP